MTDKASMGGDELQILRDEVLGLTREVHRLHLELEKIRIAPQVVATVVQPLDDGRLIVRSSGGPQFVVPVGEQMQGHAWEPGDRVGLSQSNMCAIERLPPELGRFGQDALVRRAPTTRFHDVAGIDDAVEAVREAVETPLLRADAFADMGVTPPRGVLLHGPPGTGKTLLARAVAGETQAAFLSITATELTDRFVGEGARRIRELFAAARDQAPSILFIDELDAIAGARGGDGTGATREIERTLVQLLAELDGFDDRGDVRIMAATNRMDSIDPALLRPGRFDRIVAVDPPGADGLRHIFDLHAAGMRVADGADAAPALTLLSQGGEPTGAEIAALCTEAGMRAIRHGHEAVTSEDLLAAARRLTARRERPGAVRDLYA